MCSWRCPVKARIAPAASSTDRLLHYSTTVNIRSESYRLKDKKRAGVFTVPTAKLPV